MSSTRAFLLTGALALGGIGCLADNTDSLIIQQNQVLDPSTSCAVPSSATMFTVSSGVLDVGLVEAGFDGYFIYPLLFNNLVNRSAPAVGVVSRDSIELTGAQVQLQGVLANSLPSSQTSFSLSSAAGTVFPNETLGMAVNAIPRQVALQMGNFVTGQEPSPPTVIAHYRVTGIRAGGELDSGYVDFPIQVCRGCLTGGTTLPTCVPIDKTLVKLGSCNPAQDLAVTCCTQGSTVLCGAQVPTTMTGG